MKVRSWDCAGGRCSGLDEWQTMMRDVVAYC
jgi:hypothetical protein